jgi:hypothetical protein
MQLGWDKSHCFTFSRLLLNFHAQAFEQTFRFAQAHADQQAAQNPIVQPTGIAVTPVAATPPTAPAVILAALPVIMPA